MTIKNITDELLEFREAIRHVWNVHLRYCEDVMSVEVQESFSMIEKGLFHALVLLPAARCDAIEKYRCQPMDFICLQPRFPDVKYLNLQIGKRADFGVAWGVAQAVTVDAGTELQFIEFFEWNPYAWLSLPLVKVHVSRCDANPQIVGSDALVSESDVSFVLASDDQKEMGGQTAGLIPPKCAS